MECFAKIVNGQKPLFSQKSSMVDARLGSKYASKNRNRHNLCAKYDKPDERSQKILQSNYLRILVPVHPPEDLAVNYNATFAKISWKPLEYLCWNGFPYAYKIQINSSFPNGSYTVRNDSVAPDIFEYNFTNLHPYTEHRVEVSACSGGGCSGAAVVYFRTNETGKMKLMLRKRAAVIVAKRGSIYVVLEK